LPDITPNHDNINTLNSPLLTVSLVTLMSMAAVAVFTAGTLSAELRAATPLRVLAILHNAVAHLQHTIITNVSITYNINKM